MHDVGDSRRPNVGAVGRDFTIEPQFRIEEEHLGIRLEDMVLINEKTGLEEPVGVRADFKAEIEKLMREPA